MSRKVEKYVTWGFVTFILALVVGLIWLITYSNQVEKKYDDWVDQCHNSGSVVVDIGGGKHRCMSWDEAKEKGVEFEVG